MEAELVEQRKSEQSRIDQFAEDDIATQLSEITKYRKEIEAAPKPTDLVSTRGICMPYFYSL